jgi:glyceraldehyde-3-phosphate dehydrogenase/erythrose-4-phosphate dehydrogenase
LANISVVDVSVEVQEQVTEKPVVAVIRAPAAGPVQLP